MSRVVKSAGFLPAAILLIAVSAVVYPVRAQIGFQAQFENPPSFVSRYDEVDHTFSAALYPRTEPLLTQRLERKPRLMTSYSETKTLVFNTEYYKRSSVSKTLVPVAVGAESYNSYRRQHLTDVGFRAEFNRNVASPEKAKDRAGLSLGVSLPKRLDRMFGEGGAGLTVTGYRRITFSGRSQWTDAASNDIYSASKFPTLNMEQVSRFDITGTIGSKISVKVSQDSQTDIPLSNRIEIRYKGDDDDILKAVEAGNTSLDLPRKGFVGYSSRIRGLFGIKAEAQVGSLKLTGIASQEKGTSETASVTPTGEETATDIRDYEFATNRIFDLGLPGEFKAGDSVIDLAVYEQVNVEQDLEAYWATMVVAPKDTLSYRNERISGVRVQEVERNQYEVINDPKKPPYMVFTAAGGRSRAIGVWLVIKRTAEGRIDTLGNIATGTDTLLLKLIRHNNPQNDQATWPMMWRNCYKIPTGATVEDLDLRIYKGLSGSEKTTNIFDTQALPSGETQSYLEILGLDRYNALNQRLPDGRVDEISEIFRPDWGLLIFPQRQPFNTDSTFTDSLGRTTQALQVRVPAIYENDDANSTASLNASQYFIRMSSRTRSSEINLRKPNIIEGSERVSANGKLLQRGTDYSIDYSFGRITLLSEEARDPNARIEIDYEYAPFLAIQKKTLLGMRAEYDFSDDFQIGTTVLYKSDKAEERKPRVGQETARMLVYDTDASLKLDPKFLTAAVDALPGIETEAPSSLTISGGFAQSRPDPNVNGVAYVDDFESALDRVSLGTTRTLWRQASAPLPVLEAANYTQGKMLWHSPRNLVPTDEVYHRDYGQGEGTIRTFRMIFRPRHYDVQTITFEGDTRADTAFSNPGDPHRSWGGIMRYFAQRIDAQRVQSFEIRMRGSKRGKLHFDFGRINEDINNDGVWETEDKIFPNGSIEPEEDVGLDGLPDAKEPFYHPILNPDPNEDDWFFVDGGKCPLNPNLCDAVDWENDSLRYEWLNGTEGNIDDASVLGKPDREQLTTNGNNQVNAYFSYVIDLGNDFDPFLVEDSLLPPWRTYRIPIHENEFQTIVTDPSGEQPRWDNITHVRVWFEADEQQVEWDTVEIADWHFIQMNWDDTVHMSPLSEMLPEESRTKFKVSSVSEEDGSFSAPAGVKAYKDPVTGVTEAQRGLELAYENLNYRDTCIAYKKILSVDQYSGYRRMEMYVHGDPDLQIDPGGVQTIRFFFRIGPDSVNYYEYSTGLYPGWNPANYVNFDFNEVTALKDSLIRAAGDNKNAKIAGGRGPYRVVGYPNLNQVLYFAVGVVNVDQADTTTGPTGRIWLDEMRVTDVRKDVGTAGRISIGGNFADLLTYSFAYQSQDPYFRQISAATRGGGDNNLGSGQTQTSYNYNLSFNADRFMPRAWGARLPIQYSYSKSVNTPLLRSNSDIVLPEERRREEQSISETSSMLVSEQFSHKGGNLLFDALLNRQSARVSYRRTVGRSATVPYSFGENVSVSSSFDLGIPSMPTLPIFFWTKPLPIARKTSGSRLGLYPDTWTFSADFSRNATVSDDRAYNRLSSIKRDLNGRMDVGYKMFKNLTFSYGLNIRRDLSDLDKVNISFKDLRLGEEVSYSQNFTGSYDPSLFKFFTSQLSYKANYSDDWDRTTNSRHSKLAQSWGVSGKLDHITLLGKKDSRRGGYGQGRTDVRGGGAKKEAGRRLYDYPLWTLRLATGWINPVEYSYSEDFNASLPGMVERPSLKYRFGLTREANVAVISQNRSPSSGEAFRYSGSSGFNFLGGLDVGVEYSHSVSRDLVTQGTRQEERSTNWPDLTIQIKQFRTLPVIKPMVNKVIQMFSPRTSYSRTTRETVDREKGYLTSRTISTTQTPLLSVNVNLFRKLGVTVQYDLSKDESEKYNRTNGAMEKLTKSEKNALSVTTNYSFAAPGGIGLPLFGRVKFTSTVSIQFNAKISAEKSETSSQGGAFVPSTDKSDLTWSTSLKYSFSKEINGGLTMRWQDSNDNHTRRKSHTREVQIWVELRF